MKKPELLSPVGSMDALKAAIAGGADAVYLSGKYYGARTFASNFSLEELKEAVMLAHNYQIKVYVTVNTLIYEKEIKEFFDYVSYLTTIDIDALIIQDLGMMDLIRKKYPTLELHASTQMHVHNLAGVKLLESLGIKRVVLARETPIEEIKRIKENTKMEIEVFVHGALCVSYSGQCLMSAMQGYRSGNKGACAGCCRLPYDLVKDDVKYNEEKYLLSTKDLNTLAYLDQLIECGVDSLKIEGRMKKSEYVYQTTNIYKKAINNYFKEGKTLVSKDDIDTLQAIFNREYTKGFIFHEENDNYTNEYRPNHLGIQIGKVLKCENHLATIILKKPLRINDGIRILSDEDIGFTVTKMFCQNKMIKTASNGDIITIPVEKNVYKDDIVLKTTDSMILKTIQEKINTSPKTIYIDGKLQARVGEPIKLKIIMDNYVINKESNYLVERAIKQETSKERIEQQIKKLGGTPYIFDNLIIDSSDDVFIKIDELNALRREAIMELDKIRLKRKEHPLKAYSIELPDFNKERKMNVLLETKEDYLFSKKHHFDNVYTDNVDLYYTIENCILKLPRVMNKFPIHQETLLVSELGSIYQYDNVETDFSLNVTNSYTVAFLHSLGVKKITLSYELTKEQIRDIVEGYKTRYQKHPNLEVIIYARPEVMVSRYNLLKKYNLDKANLKDKNNNLFPVVTKDNLMYIYLYKPIIKDDYLDYYDMGINHLRVQILDEKDYKNINHLLS